MSQWASKWTMPTGRSAAAMARKIGSVTEWSPPADSGTVPAAWTRSKKAAISASAPSSSNGFSAQASPRSATLHWAYGSMPEAWLTLRIRVDWLRISRGPWRAPGRLVTPPSKGTPISPMSTPSGLSLIGVRMKVATPV